jgi:hypothetical protein
VSECLHDLFIKLEIDRSRAVIKPSGGDRLEFEFEIAPHQFVAQAALDLQSGGQAALFNSITNSRRAILCQMDRVIGGLGFPVHKTSTKNKTELLRFLGLPTPNILRKVGQTRNELEHEYKLPPRDKVEDALDIALLFVHALDRHLETFWGDFYFGNEDEQIEDEFEFRRHISFHYDPEKKELTASASQHISKSKRKFPWSRKPLGECVLTSADPIYKHCIRLALLEYIALPETHAVKELFDELRLP